MFSRLYNAYLPCIYAYMATKTLELSLRYIYIYIYLYICSTRPNNTMHKPLALQESAVSMA